MTEHAPGERQSQEYTYKEALRAASRLASDTLTGAPRPVREYTSHLAASKGKGIRAAALLACASGDAGSVRPDAVRMAAAIELTHLATLVHDDVMDDAPTRRGLITLQKKYGKRTAVICGDYLLCAALQVLAGCEERDRLSQSRFAGDITRVCLGELEQHLNNGNLSLSVYRYLKIISGKTAALFEAAFMAGALLLSPGASELSRYRRLGRYVGMIFQLKDDCNDFEQDESAAKKPVRSDYEQGVVTLPLIAALTNDEKLKDSLSGGLSGERLAAAVERAGGLRFTHALAEKYYRKAAGLISGLGASKAKAAMLGDLLDLAFFGPGGKRVVG